MKYFAMIDGEQRGPFSLEELRDAGVRPDTYVWCKEMDDWQRADEVADICRHFRQRIFDLMHPKSAPGLSSVGQARDMGKSLESDASSEDMPIRFQRMIERSGETPGTPEPETTDTTKAPTPTLFIAILMTIFCFPITGAVAIYYSYMAMKTWQEAQRSDAKHSRQLYSNEERQNLRKRAHDYSRQAKMWIGITFFLSLIFYAMIIHKI